MKSVKTIIIDCFCLVLFLPTMDKEYDIWVAFFISGLIIVVLGIYGILQKNIYGYITGGMFIIKGLFNLIESRLL